MGLEAKVSNLISMCVDEHPCYASRLSKITVGTHNLLWRNFTDIFTQTWSRSKAMRRKKAIMEDDTT